MRRSANPIRTRSQAWQGLAVLALFLFSGKPASGQEAVPELVEVYWQDSRTLPVPGVTNVAVLDESICRAQVATDKIQFWGLARGETVAFVWANERRYTLRVSVIAPPEKLPPPRLSQSALDALGNGTVGSSMQTFVDPQGNTDYLFLHRFDWQQQSGKDRLSIYGQAQDSTAVGAPLFNANSLSVRYSTPDADLALIDFPLFVNGGLETKISPYSAYNVYMVRGGEVTLREGTNQFELFAGTTIPPYYLTLSSTRDIAGLNFKRKQSEKLYLYATTGWVNSPFQQSSYQIQRENSFFQTGGLVYCPDSQWAVQGSVGGSTRGGLAQGTVSYTGGRLTGFVTGTASSANFPLNQLQLFFAGGSSIAAGSTLRLNSRIGGSVYYQHSVTKSTAFLPAGGASDYVNPNLSIAISPREGLTLNYTYTHSSLGQALEGRSQGQRLDVALDSRFAGAFTNTAEFTAGALSDPLQLNAQGELTALDALTFPMRIGYITLGFQHTRNNPSLVNRLNQDIGLLPPALQQLFLADPVAFVDSPLLDPQIRALLENMQPTNTEVSVSGQFHIRDRLNFSPTVGYIRNVAGLGRNSDSKLLGYSLSYQITPSIQLTSSLSNVFLLDTQSPGIRRTTMVTMGINKMFRGVPGGLLPFHPQRRTLRGRVFRDLNVNGVYRDGEPGLAGVRVELNTGEAVLTDSLGRFEFSGLAPDAYRVSVPLRQFSEPVRVTTPTEVRVDLLEAKTVEVDFGIVNFARVIGSVFNDYRLDGKRQPDAKGMRSIGLLLSGDKLSRKVVTDGGGEFELYDIPPGEYRISLDRSTLPPNYVGPAESVNIHLEPTATVVADIPVQALRSVSGHVYFQPNGSSHIATPANGQPGAKSSGTGNQPSRGAEGDGAAFQPLAGVQLTIDHTTATTGADGAFVLRNLPAGELTLTLVPTRPLPPNLSVPKGKIRLPDEPIQVENATIVISNPELVNYILPASGGQP